METIIYRCPECQRVMLNKHERCSGSFLDTGHPSNVAPVAERGEDPDGLEPTCTVTEAKRRHTCLQTALFHLRLGREALAAVQGTDLSSLDSLIDDAQEGLAYYQPAADAR